jgi:hypothetical protein
VGRSCGNRHCATCQHEKTSGWLKRQTTRLLPVPHFLVTFTVPPEVRDVLRADPIESLLVMTVLLNMIIKQFYISIGSQKRIAGGLAV